MLGKERILENVSIIPVTFGYVQTTDASSENILDEVKLQFTKTPSSVSKPKCTEWQQTR